MDFALACAFYGIVEGYEAKGEKTPFKTVDKLGANDSRSAKYDAKRPKSFSPLKQVNLGILDGTVIVFSDAHFIPSQRTTAFKGLLWAIQEFVDIIKSEIKTNGYVDVKFSDGGKKFRNLI